MEKRRRRLDSLGERKARFVVIYARIIAVAVLAIALAGLVWKIWHTGVVAGRAEVQASWDAETAQEIKQQAAAKAKADADTRTLQDMADTNRRKANAEILALNVRVGEYAARLRQRPERPDAGSVPTVAGPGPGGCTGANLYREDAGHLVRLAADADRISVALKSCQAAYESAREALK